MRNLIVLSAIAIALASARPLLAKTVRAAPSPILTMPSSGPLNAHVHHYAAPRCGGAPVITALRGISLAKWPSFARRPC